MADGTYVEDEVIPYGLFLDRRYVQVTIEVKSPSSQLSVVVNKLEFATTDYELTGQFLWPAAALLCRFMLTTLGRSLFSNKKTIELGAGVGACGYLAAQLATSVIMTDHSQHVVDLIQDNAALNPSVKDKCKTAEFEWGLEKHLKQFDEHGYDLVFGTDILYFAPAVDALVRSVDLLLTNDPTARFILAFKTRKESTEQLFQEVLAKYNLKSFDLALSHPDEEASPERKDPAAADPLVPLKVLLQTRREMADINLTTILSDHKGPLPAPEPVQGIWGELGHLMLIRRVTPPTLTDPRVAN